MGEPKLEADVETLAAKAAGVLSLFSGVLATGYIVWLCGLTTRIAFSGPLDAERGSVLSTCVVSATGVVLGAVMVARGHPGGNPLDGLGSVVTSIKNAIFRR